MCASNHYKVIHFDGAVFFYFCVRGPIIVLLMFHYYIPMNVCAESRDLNSFTIRQKVVDKMRRIITLDSISFIICMREVAGLFLYIV